MKVLHLPSAVGGNAWALSRGEQALGLASDVLYQTQSGFGYPADIVLDKTGKYANIFLQSVLAAFRIPQRYDVLHFNFGSSLIDIPERGINHFDLSLYKKQRLFVTYNGCDVRQKFKRTCQTDISACKYPDCRTTLCMSEELDALKAKRVLHFKEYGAGFFALNPDLMHFLPEGTVFLPYTVAGWDTIEPAPPPSCKNGKLTLVHAPTNRPAKGTAPLLKAVENLQKRHPGKLELRLVEGVPYKEALQIYREADLIVDQLRIGWYGAFAVEAMKMGKPVMVYINEEDLRFVPAQMAKDCHEAFIEASEETVEAVLEECLLDPARLKRTADHAKEYIEAWHRPENVARITKEAYES